MSVRQEKIASVIKKELKVENVNNLLSITDFANSDELPSIEEEEEKLIEMKKSREALGSVNLRADLETEKFKISIKKMEDDRADLYSAIVKLKASIEELNQKGREKLLEAFSKVNRNAFSITISSFTCNS